MIRYSKNWVSLIKKQVCLSWGLNYSNYLKTRSIIEAQVLNFNFFKKRRILKKQMIIKWKSQDEFFIMIYEINIETNSQVYILESIKMKRLVTELCHGLTNAKKFKKYLNNEY